MKTLLKLLLLSLIALSFSACKKGEEVKPDTIDQLPMLPVETILSGNWVNANRIVYYYDNANYDLKTFDDGLLSSITFNTNAKFVTQYRGGVKEFEGNYEIKPSNRDYMVIVKVGKNTTHTIFITQLSKDNLKISSGWSHNWTATKAGQTFSGFNAHYEESYSRQ